jgi:hypothetical protein
VYHHTNPYHTPPKEKKKLNRRLTPTYTPLPRMATASSSLTRSLTLTHSYLDGSWILEVVAEKGLCFEGRGDKMDSRVGNGVLVSSFVALPVLLDFLILRLVLASAVCLSVL